MPNHPSNLTLPGPAGNFGDGPGFHQLPQSPLHSGGGGTGSYATNHSLSPRLGISSGGFGHTNGGGPLPQIMHATSTELSGSSHGGGMSGFPSPGASVRNGSSGYAFSRTMTDSGMSSSSLHAQAGPIQLDTIDSGSSLHGEDEAAMHRRVRSADFTTGFSQQGAGRRGVQGGRSAFPNSCGSASRPGQPQQQGHFGQNGGGSSAHGRGGYGSRGSHGGGASFDRSQDGQGAASAGFGRSASGQMTSQVLHSRCVIDAASSCGTTRPLRLFGLSHSSVDRQAAVRS